MVKFEKDNLSEKQLEEIRKAYQVLKKIQEFEAKANMKLFEFLFEERAEHMFIEVFVKRHNRNAVAFLMNIDDKARQEVTVNIFGHDLAGWEAHPLYAHCH